LYWLEHVFNRHTKVKTGNHRRLLIVDSYNSHVNMRFINYCDQNHILLAILPPHSIHRLQPLDVGLFAPLAQYYTQQLDKFIIETQGLVHVTKRHFWKFFIQAFTQAFTEQNIRSNWEATELYSFNP
jgi:hypothetical protein